MIDFCDHVTVLKDGVGHRRSSARRARSDRARAPDGRPRPAESLPALRLAADGRPRPRDQELFGPRGAATSISSFVAARSSGIGGLVGQGQEDFLLGLYGAVPAAADRFRVVRERRRGAERAVREGRRGQRRRPRLCAGRSPQGGPAPPAFDRLQPAAAVVRAAAAPSAGAGAAGGRDHRAPGPAPQHQGRPATAGAGAVRRQPAEGRAGRNGCRSSRRSCSSTTRRAASMSRPSARSISCCARWPPRARPSSCSSSDTPELVHLCDRVVVFHKGRVARDAAACGSLRGGDRRRRDGRAQRAGARRGSGLMLGQGRATLLGGPVAPQRRPRRAVPRARAVRGRSTPSSFPAFSPVGAIAKFIQSWFPTALVAMAQTILMLTGGIDLSIGAMVSLGAVIAASTMQGPLGIVRRRSRDAGARRRRRRDRRRVRRDRPLSGDHRHARALLHHARRRAAHPAAAGRLCAAVACPTSSPARTDRGASCSCCSSFCGSSIWRRRLGSA